MGYFPFFMEIEDKKGVVLGGGQVAARKVEKPVSYTHLDVYKRQASLIPRKPFSGRRRRIGNPITF